MARAFMKMADKNDLYLQNTQVENLFISEFLPEAPGEFVKVYLFGLMYAQNNKDMDVALISRVLHVAEADIIQAWNYWAGKGLMKVSASADVQEYSIEYVSQIDMLYGIHVEEGEEKPDTAPVVTTETEAGTESAEEETEEEAVSRVVNIEIRAIFEKYERLTGRMLSSEDAWKIGDTIRTYNILPDVMSYAVDYCISEERASINAIVNTTIKWAEEGCHNLAEVREYIDRHSKRNAYYTMIFREMGFARLPNPMDREMMDRWFDEMGYSIKDVLNACRASAGLRDPSLKYVNKVLENQRLEKGGINTRPQPGKTSYGQADKPTGAASGGAMVSKKVLKEYYDYLRLESEKEQDARIDELCSKVIALRDLFDFENSLNREMLSIGLSPDSKNQRQLIRDQRRELEEEKKRLLRDNGYSEDYLDRKYRCNICKDTGITDDGKVCACSEARAREAYTWNQKRNH